MEIKLAKGFLIGEAQDEFSGVTVIVAEHGAVGGVDVRGGAPGTHETDLLKSEKAMQKINAVMLTGGSAYGLGAVAGVMQALREKHMGFCTAGKVIPIVPAAVIYDLNSKEYHFPTPEMAYTATQNAFCCKPQFGQNGVGRGATVGKIRGLKYASKGGIGAASIKTCGVTVTAIVAVNAMGDVFDHNTGVQLSGAKLKDGSFLNTEQCLLKGDFGALLFGTNTTIGCILTDAKLSKVEANKVAQVAHNGLARTIRPVHTNFDGDTLFVMASAKRKVLNMMLVEVAAAEAVAQAVENAVKSGIDYQIIYSEDEDIVPATAPKEEL